MRMSSTRKEAQLKKQLEQVTKDLEAEKKKRKVVCGACSKPMVIGKMDIKDIQQYIPPSGCTGGDYWTHSHYEFNCPSCKGRYVLGKVYDPSIYKEGEEFHTRHLMYTWIDKNKYSAKTLTTVKPERRYW